MPILPESDPAWLRLPKSVDVLLPDIPEIAADAGNAPIFGVAKGKYVATAAEIFQLSSQVSLGSLIANVGMPAKATFDVILEAMRIDVKAEVIAQLKAGGRNLIEAWKAIQDEGENGTALAEVTVETAVGAGVNMAAVIPVAGVILKIAWTLGKLLKGISDIAKSSGKGHAEILYPPTTFNPSLDNDVVNAVLSDVFSKRAWGRRWGPPAMGEGVGSLPPFGVLHTEGGGFEIKRRAGHQGGVATGEEIDWSTAGWLGMIPGTPYLHQGIQVTSGGSVHDMGEILLPSARQVLVWLWGTVLGHGSKVTPAMWCVDSSALQLWSQYIHDLHVFVHEDLDAKQSIKQRIIDYYNKRGNQKVFGWGTGIKPKSNEQDHYVPTRQAKDLRARQMGFLDTIMCAYVDDSYSALEADSSMRDRWDQRRRQLLEHPARCDVDLSNVPDSDYREALIDSGARSLAVCGRGPTHFKAGTGFTRPPGLPEGDTYASPTPPPTRKKRRLPLIVPFAAVGVALFAGYKAGIIPALKLPKLKL